MKLLARWTVFIEPLRQVVTVSSGRLKDCVLCIRISIAMIAMDGCQLYVFNLTPDIHCLKDIRRTTQPRLGTSLSGPTLFNSPRQGQPTIILRRQALTTLGRENA